MHRGSTGLQCLRVTEDFSGMTGRVLITSPGVDIWGTRYSCSPGTESPNSEVPQCTGVGKGASMRFLQEAQDKGQGERQSRGFSWGKAPRSA